MIAQHSIIKIIKEFLVEKQLLKSENTSITDFEDFFMYLIESRQKFNSAYLLNYLWKNISAKDMAKRKTSARDLEDYLSIIFNGIISDETKRVNKQIDNQDIFIENHFITNFVLSNRREKGDLIFANNYQLSIKTLIKTNKEINLGSFEKTALFYLLDVEDYLNERKGKEVKINNETLTVGLGSRNLLKNLLKLLEHNNKLKKFQERFIDMAEHIFSADFLIAIKDDEIMDLYFLPRRKFINLLKEIIIDIDKFLMVVNRWEGNSLRVDRSKILNISKHIKLDFRFLQDSILKDFSNFEEKISSLLVKYINDPQDNYKQLIFEELDKIINTIEQNREGIS
ncbi:MAG: hypothetical protein IGQ45_05650 [Cyanobacterium sp. T60_A2020_053]|nr:hypothetical protein [Cyanobacterium sp. T60_A2020_053]